MVKKSDVQKQADHAFAGQLAMYENIIDGKLNAYIGTPIEVSVKNALPAVVKQLIAQYRESGWTVNLVDQKFLIPSSRDAGPSLHFS